MKRFSKALSAGLIATSIMISAFSTNVVFADNSIDTIPATPIQVIEADGSDTFAAPVETLDMFLSILDAETSPEGTVLNSDTVRVENSDVVFELYDENGDFIETAVKTTVDGRFIFTDLIPGNTYKLVEVSHTGYDINSAMLYQGTAIHSVNLKDTDGVQDNSLTFVFQSSGAGDIVEYFVTNDKEVAPEPVETLDMFLSILDAETSPEGTVLNDGTTRLENSDVVFELYDENGNFIQTAVKTTVDGRFIFTDLIPGNTYKLVEVSHTGYDINTAMLYQGTAIHSVNLKDTDGVQDNSLTFVFQGSGAGDIVEYFVTNDKTVTPPVVEEKLSITVTILDAETSPEGTILNDSTAGLADSDVVFKLYDENGNFIADALKTTVNGQFIFTDLEPNTTYKLVEVSHTGYDINSAVLYHGTAIHSVNNKDTDGVQDNSFTFVTPSSNPDNIIHYFVTNEKVATTGGGSTGGNNNGNTGGGDTGGTDNGSENDTTIEDGNVPLTSTPDVNTDNTPDVTITESEIPLGTVETVVDTTVDIEEEETPLGATPQTSDENNLMLYAGFALILVLLASALVFTKKRKS